MGVNGNLDFEAQKKCIYPSIIKVIHSAPWVNKVKRCDTLLQELDLRTTVTESQWL